MLWVVQFYCVDSREQMKHAWPLSTVYPLERQHYLLYIGSVICHKHGFFYLSWSIKTEEWPYTEYLVKISWKVCKFVLCVSVCAQVLNNIIGADPLVWAGVRQQGGQWEDSGCEAEPVNTVHWLSWVTYRGLASGSCKIWETTFSQFHDNLTIIVF